MKVDLVESINPKNSSVKREFEVLKPIDGLGKGDSINLLSREGVPVDKLWRKYFKKEYIKLKVSKPKPKISKSKSEDDLND